MTKRKNNTMPSERRGRDLCGFILGSQPCDLEYRGKTGGQVGEKTEGAHVTSRQAGYKPALGKLTDSMSLPAPSLTSHLHIFYNLCPI